MKQNRQPRICITCFLVAHGMDFFLFNYIFTLLPHQVFRTIDDHDTRMFNAESSEPFQIKRETCGQSDHGCIIGRHEGVGYCKNCSLVLSIYAKSETRGSSALSVGIQTLPVL